ncbi:hypothetical protein [Streptomonospora alba]|uniref:hypothetical protein n=1 Tax=Streptomonospora alba TaxID=183763 RepID=UPI0012EE243E|nr:hypothetical protein [Streptomonospora alba]
MTELLEHGLDLTLAKVLLDEAAIRPSAPGSPAGGTEVPERPRRRSADARFASGRAG